jgi:hypothetical protein
MTAREIALKCWGGLRDPLYRQEVWSVEDVIAAIEDGMRQERERCAEYIEDNGLDDLARAMRKWA